MLRDIREVSGVNTGYSAEQNAQLKNGRDGVKLANNAGDMLHAALNCVMMMQLPNLPFVCYRKLADDVQRLLPPPDDYGMATFKHLKSTSQVQCRNDQTLGLESSTAKEFCSSKDIGFVSDLRFSLPQLVDL